MASFTSYSSEILFSSKAGTIRTVHLQWTAPDGVAHSRYEMEHLPPEDKSNPKAMAPKVIKLSNRGGQWLLNDKKKLAISLKNASLAVPDASLQDLAEKNFGELTSSFVQTEDNHRGIPCWKITQKIDEKAQQLIFDQTLNALASGKETPEKQKTKMRKYISSVVVYEVGKEDKILYGQETFNSDGDKVASCMIDRFVHGIPMDEGLFEVPRGYKTVSPKDEAESVQLIAEIFMGKSVFLSKASRAVPLFEIIHTETLRVGLPSL
jgi:hypothetical protein